MREGRPPSMGALLFCRTIASPREAPLADSCLRVPACGPPPIGTSLPDSTQPRCEATENRSSARCRQALHGDKMRRVREGHAWSTLQALHESTLYPSWHTKPPPVGIFRAPPWHCLLGALCLAPSAWRSLLGAACMALLAWRRCPRLAETFSRHLPPAASKTMDEK